VDYVPEGFVENQMLAIIVLQKLDVCCFVGGGGKG
jgi:hypothetical protein